MSVKSEFKKMDIDNYLKELAKEYKKRNRNSCRAEIIIVGGAAILLNYGFREMTRDIDAEIIADADMKAAINHVTDKFNLPNGWINSDFKKTTSYSNKLRTYSKYYRTYSNIVEIRVVKAEYLVAMKLVSGRLYKSDQSDIVGIIHAQAIIGEPLTYDKIDTAIKNLYGDWSKVPKTSKITLEKALSSDSLDSLIETATAEEKVAHNTLLDVEKKYPGVTNKDNIDEILSIALSKKEEKDDL